MEGPCFTIFSDTFMDDLKTSCINKLEFTPLAYYRYVDDIFVNLKNELNTMLDTLNLNDNRLKFTRVVSCST